MVRDAQSQEVSVKEDMTQEQQENAGGSTTEEENSKFVKG